MKLLNIVYVKGDDYDAVYVLGKLWEQDHSINWVNMLKDHVVHISEIKYADFDWLINRSGYPHTLSEVVFDSTNVRSNKN